MGKGAKFYLRLRYLKNCLMLNIYQYLGREIVLVYQMGKSGSTAIANAIDSIPNFHAVHVHRLNPERVQEISKRHRAGETYYRDMSFEMYLFNWIQKRRTVKIVTTLRDPFSHSCSSFFQNMARSTRGKYRNTNESFDNLESYFFNWEEFGGAVNWLDSELNFIIQQDIYSLYFDKEVGWAIYKIPGFEVLILKSEINDAEKSSALEKFFGTEHVKIRRENSARSKDYYANYEEFIQRLKWPEDKVRELLSSKYVEHFYDADELLEYYHGNH